jgi:hypothetical protein
MMSSPSSRVSPARQFGYFQVPLDLIRQRVGEDGAKMYEWFVVAFHGFASWAKALDWNTLLQAA